MSNEKFVLSKSRKIGLALISPFVLFILVCMCAYPILALIVGTLMTIVAFVIGLSMIITDGNF